MAALSSAGFCLLLGTRWTRGCTPAGLSVACSSKGAAGSQLTLGAGRRPLSRRGRGPNCKAIVRGAAGEPTTETAGVPPQLLSELSEYLERELPRLFTSQGMQSEGRFDDRVEFEDPITRYDSLSGYLFNIAMLRQLFDPVFQLHSVYQSGPAELTTRWTMKMYFKLLPWQPEVIFSGLSIYGINPSTGRFRSHRDVWDSIQDNAYFSREGLMDLLRQSSRLYRNPQDLGSPEFDVLVRRASYEVRQYPELDMALTTWKQGEARVGQIDPLQLQALQKFADGLPAAAQGVKGDAKDRLGMPLVWQLSERRPGSRREGERDIMFGRPLRGVEATTTQAQSGSEAAVSVERVPRRAVAVTSFAGDASLEQFEAAEALLRASLLKDGAVPLAGPGAFTAAKYYQPSGFRLPAFQRNEVMIPLEGFSWP